MSTRPINVIRSIAAFAHTAPSADNSQPWHFTWDGEHLQAHYDSARVGGKTFSASSPATLIAIGAAVENFYDISMRYDTNLTLNLLPGASAIACCRLSGLANASLSGDAQLGDPATRRHTNRFAYRKDPVPGPILSFLGQMTEGRARATTVSSPASIKSVAKLANIASRVRFQSREVHEWLASSLRFDKQAVESGNGMDVRTLDLPPGGAQFLKFTREWARMSLLNRFGAYRFMAAIDSGPLKVAPAVVAVLAPPTALGAIEAGRLLTRAWTYLNSQGLAVHPYYVVSDQLNRLAESTIPTHLVPQVEELKLLNKNFFELDSNETLHMLLRIGYPTKKPIRSRRIPLDMVFTDLTATAPNASQFDRAT